MRNDIECYSVAKKEDGNNSGQSDGSEGQSTIDESSSSSSLSNEATSNESSLSNGDSESESDSNLAINLMFVGLVIVLMVSAVLFLLMCRRSKNK